jgi:tryptophanyl-tRNA synthetase
MSKSYDNTIGIFDEGDVLKEKVYSIETDSIPLSEPMEPEGDNVFALIRLFADAQTQAEIAEKYRRSDYGYGHAKGELLELIEAHFAEARERRRALSADDEDYVRDVLREGAKRARERADRLMEHVRACVGLDV